jgi:hypothetical protein
MADLGKRGLDVVGAIEEGCQPGSSVWSLSRWPTG